MSAWAGLLLKKKDRDHPAALPVFPRIFANALVDKENSCQAVAFSLAWSGASGAATAPGAPAVSEATTTIGA